ncbi:LOW QUALITY PROTEIN: pyridoxal kinase-like [Liolophura sinensis]|uniref:LOW QUALITY PROTEIN: pyridoxal kinase-like n=1 Tax=Liolophura sinensis TaxID=3198878 RepID=UPI003158E699
MADDNTCRVLSIQSSVVYGYVGNKSASFPLQLLGFDVSPINSVQFSNHTGYKTFKGQVLHSGEVSNLYEGLKLNGLPKFSHILTGYIGSSSFLEKVSEIVLDLRKHNPNLIFACDPVMGDNGKLYVKPELLPVYRDKVVPLADIVTPNQFEAELLSGVKITSEAEALLAMEKLHQCGPKTVVLSSTNLGSEGHLLCMASSVRNGKRECYKLQFPSLPVYFSGTGDLFSALLLAWLQRDDDLKLALEKTVACVQAVLKRTMEYAQAQHKNDEALSKPSPDSMELRLVQSKTDIENPTIVYKASSIPL